MLDRCEFPVDDSYYRLPFADGYPTWIMSQGNENPDPTATHCVENVDGVPCYNRFAFDFVANAGTPILAARGGTVIWVDESNTANCSPCDGCTEAPNSVFIEHEDGTVGVYFHMQPNGVFVSAGDRVKRGDLIAAVGNTGCSSQPHLHFQEDPEIGASQSSRSSFETAILKEVPFVGAVCDFGEMAVCQVPEPGDGLCSTNEP